MLHISGILSYDFLASADAVYRCLECIQSAYLSHYYTQGMIIQMEMDSSQGFTSKGYTLNAHNAHHQTPCSLCALTVLTA